MDDDDDDDDDDEDDDYFFLFHSIWICIQGWFESVPEKHSDS